MRVCVRVTVCTCDCVRVCAHVPVQLQPVLSCLHQETRRFSDCPSVVDCLPAPSTPAVCTDRRPRGLPLGLRWPLTAPEPHAHHTWPSLCHSRPGAAFLNSQDRGACCPHPFSLSRPLWTQRVRPFWGSQHQCLLSCAVAVNQAQGMMAVCVGNPIWGKSPGGGQAFAPHLSLLQLVPHHTSGPSDITSRFLQAR